MSLDITIRFKKPRKSNYFLEHPYHYDRLSQRDLDNFDDENEWRDNITHNLGEMASHIPVAYKKGGKIRKTTLYYLLWRPEEVNEEFMNTNVTGRLLVPAIAYMLSHRKELLQYEAENGWGTFNGFMKFLLNLLQACQDNPDCEMSVSR